MDTIPKDDIYTQLLPISNLFSNKYYNGLPQNEDAPRNKIEVRMDIRRVDKYRWSKTFYFKKGHNVNEFCLKLGYFICKDNTPMQIFLSLTNNFNQRVLCWYDIDQMYICCGWTRKRHCTSRRMFDICKMLRNYYFKYIIPMSLRSWNAIFLLWIWHYKRIQINNKYKLICVFCDKDFIQEEGCDCNNNKKYFNCTNTRVANYLEFPQCNGFTLKEIEKKYPEDDFICQYIACESHKNDQDSQSSLLLLYTLRQYKHDYPIELLSIIIDFYPFDLQDCYLVTLY